MSDSTIRDKILQASKKRFGHYGFNKTSMTEIAKDCDMSAANIYRHFNGKNDILATLAIHIFRQQEADLTRLCETNFKDSSSKLHAFFQKALSLTHQHVTVQPKMKEMVDFICQERIDLVTPHKEAKEKLIHTILQEGVDNGEFIISNIEKTAKAFKIATMMFHTPLFMDFCKLPELESSCTSVVNILLAAITRHPEDS